MHSELLNDASLLIPLTFAILCEHERLETIIKVRTIREGPVASYKSDNFGDVMFGFVTQSDFVIFVAIGGIAQ